MDVGKVIPLKSAKIRMLKNVFVPPQKPLKSVSAEPMENADQSIVSHDY
jgi:hypothetical protein